MVAERKKACYVASVLLTNVPTIKQSSFTYEIDTRATNYNKYIMFYYCVHHLIFFVTVTPVTQAR